MNISIFHQLIRRSIACFAQGIVVSLAVGLFISGCIAPSGPNRSAVAEKKVFVPRPKPPGFDAQRAQMALSDIPDNPPRPEKSSGKNEKEISPHVHRHLAEARRLFAEQRFAETVGELENVLRDDAGNTQALRLASVVRLLAGNEMLARFFAMQVLSARPDDLACHYVIGRVAEQEGDTEKALRRYRQALKCPWDKQDAPYRALTHVHLGLILQEQGYYRAAAYQLKAYRRMVQELGGEVKRHPELAAVLETQNESIVLRLAQAYELLDRYADAAEALKALADSKTEDYPIHSALVRLLMLADQGEQAANRARDFVDNTHGDRQAVQLLLAVYREQQRLADGLDVIEGILADQPGNIDLGLVYADALQNVGRRQQAVEHVQKLIEAHPEQPEPRWKLIALYRQGEQWADWLDAAVKQTAAQPDHYSRLNDELQEISPEVARRLVEQARGDSSDKAGLIPQELPDDRSASVLDYLLGKLCMRLDQYEQAGAFFEQARQRSMNFILPVLGQTELHMQRCQWEQAIKVIEEFQEYRPVPAYELQKLLARCYEGLDRYEQAVEAYRKALDLLPRKSETRMQLARLYERMGLLQRARAQYQKITSLDPDFMEAREALVQSWLMQLKDREDQKKLGDLRKQLLTQIEQMQERAPYAPATLRSKALLKLLLSGARDQKAYINTLRKLVENFPEDLHTRRLLVGVLFAAGDDQAARIQARQILEPEPHCPVANEILAMVQIRALQFEEAARHLEKMLECYPNRLSWIRMLANLRLLERDYAGSAELWRHLLSIARTAERKAAYRQQLIRVYRLGEQYDKARKVASDWLEETGDLMPRHQLLLIDLEAEDYDQYLRRCRNWLMQKPQSAQLRNWLLLGLQKAGSDDEAVLTALRWLAEESADDVILRWIMQTLQSADKYDQAVEIVRSQAAATKAETKTAYLKILGELYLLAGEYDQAVAVAQRLIAGGEEAYQEQLGLILVKAGRYDKALSHYRRLLSQASAEAAKAGILRQMALVRQQQQRPDLALRHLREAHELAPKDVGINNDLGYTLAEAGQDLDDAERMVRMAVGQDFLQPAYLDSMGWVQYKKGRFAEARKWLRRASALEGGEDPVIYEHLGDACWRLGKTQEAMIAWKNALGIHACQVDQDLTVSDKGLTERIQEKLEAAAGEDEPAVAPIVGEGEQ